MYIRLFNNVSGIINSRIFVEEEQHYYDADILKADMKRIFSAMKKKDGFNDVSFQLCSDAGFYVVVDRWDIQSESFRTTFHERWNSSDSPVMKSQKNVLSWALDILKSDEMRKTETA